MLTTWVVAAIADQGLDERGKSGNPAIRPHRMVHGVLRPSAGTNSWKDARLRYTITTNQKDWVSDIRSLTALENSSDTINLFSRRVPAIFYSINTHSCSTCGVLRCGKGKRIEV